MTGGNEVSREVAAIEEKCGLDMSSYQDLPKTDCIGGSHRDQVNDPDNSYVFVTGAGFLSDDILDKEHLVEVIGSSVESKAAFDVQNGKLDVLNEEVSEFMNKEENGNVEGGTVDLPVVNCNGVPLEQERSSLDGDGVQVLVTDAPKEQSGKIQSAAVAEIQPIEVLNGRLESSSGAKETEIIGKQNGELNVNLENVAETETKPAENLGKLESSASAEIKTVGESNENFENEAETEIKPFEDPNTLLEGSTGAEVEAVGYQNGELENVAETEVVEDPKGILESSNEAEIETLGDRNGILENEAETVIKEVENPNGILEIWTGSEIETATQHESLENVAETEVIEDPNGTIESSAGVEIETHGYRNGILENEAGTVIKEVENPNGRFERSIGSEIESAAHNGNLKNTAEIEVKQVEDPSAILESLMGAKIETFEDQTGEIEGVAESDIKHAENPKGKLEVTAGAETEKVMDPNEKNDPVAEIEHEKVQDQIKSDSSLVSTEDPEVEASVLRGKAKFKNLSSKIMEADNTNDEHKDKNDVGFTETSGICQRSQNLVLDGVKCELIDVSREVQNEVVREVAATAENDVLLETSTDCCIESHPIDNEETLEQETETDLGSDVMENQKYDSLPIIQGGLEHADEPNTVVDTDDGHAKTVSDLPLEEEDISVVHVEDSSVKIEVFSSPPSVINVKLKPEVHSSAASTEVLTSHVTCVNEDLNEVEATNEGASNIVSVTTDAEGMVDQFDNAGRCMDENSCLQENKDTENPQSETVSMAAPEDSSTSVISGKDKKIVAATKPFNYLIRIPRFSDESLKEQIMLAKLKVDEKTKLRDVIQVQIKEKRADSQVHGVDYEYAKRETRNARGLVRSKRMEIDSVQSVINKAKNATSIEDTNNRIYSIEHMIQHETLPLKEERQLIREIKQLKQLREQLSSNMGTRDEIEQALQRREEPEEKLKILRKELNVLKDNVSKSEAAALEAERRYDHEIKIVEELQAKYRAADDVRQEVYAMWQSLRKELSEKNKYFFKYKDDGAAANNYAYNRDIESVYRLCTDQVENIMELLNTNVEFRKEYISFNKRSTVWRFGSFDGRLLNPDEEPPFLPSFIDKRVHKSSVSTPAKVDFVQQSPPDLKIVTTFENGTTEDIPLKKVTEHENQTVKTKGTVKAVLANSMATVVSRDVVSSEVVKEEPVKSKEEIELERKEREMRKQEAEAKIREQRRLEELTRANEARQRKKRQAEKLQMRTELKAQKEAEQRIKEREKRQRKKERKKAVETDVNDGNNHSDSTESTVENPNKEVETQDMPPVVAKKPQKPKQSKTKSVPPLRNRNRKKWQQYAYLGAATLLVFILFWVGNMGLFASKNLNRRGPLY